jgi:acyl-CoA synthetase (AMP-forming)/AMP-acid ligase II
VSGEARLPDAVQTIPEMLAFWATRTPDAPAFVIPGNANIPYAELWRRTAAVAAALRQGGVGRHDRVVLLLPEGPELALALLGAASAAIAMPLSHALTVAELAGALRGFGPAGAIIAPSVDEPVRATLVESGAAVFAHSGEGGLDQIAPATPSRRPPRVGDAPQPEDIAFVVQTSGTTGLPKRVPRAQGRVVRDGLQHRERFGLHRGDRAVAVAPLTLSLGLTVLLHTIAAGAALIFPPSTEPRSLLTTVDEERATWLFLSAGYVELLARVDRKSVV